MTQSLIAKLDDLETKVITLARTLEHSKHEQKKSRDQAESLLKENESLRKKVEQAQGQINEMINQWFPELELNTENKIGSA